MSPLQAPMIGVVVVHFGHPSRTTACLDAVEGLTWPAASRRVVVVDNTDDATFARRVATSHPWVEVVRSPSNVGFGAGCNRGIDALGDVRFVALLNNDALPEAGWLEPLVASAERHGFGAVTSKVLLTGRHVTFDLRLEPRSSPPGEWRTLGVQLSGARLGDADVTASIRLVSGFWGWEHDAITIGGRFSWSGAAARGQVAVDPARADGPLALRLSSPSGPVTVEVTSDDLVRSVDVGAAPTWIEVAAATTAHDVINNVGTFLLPDGSSRDRGYLEPDVGQYEEPAPVFGWSGTAVLLDKAMLDDIGGFDERLFLYYEDVDLSVRGRLRGWTYGYEPASVVRHRHSGAVGEDAAISRHLTGRNRALVLAKVAPAAVASAALLGQLATVGAALQHDVVGRLRRGRRPTTRHLADEARIVVGILERLPGSLLRRRKVLGNAVVSPAELWRRVETSQSAPMAPTGSSQVRGRTWQS